MLYDSILDFRFDIKVRHIVSKPVRGFIENESFEILKTVCCTSVELYHCYQHINIVYLAMLLSCLLH